MSEHSWIDSMAGWRRKRITSLNSRKRRDEKSFMGARGVGDEKTMEVFKDWNEQWLETQSDERYKTRRVKMLCELHVG